MPSFFEERLAVLVDANSQFEVHRRYLRKAAWAIQSALTSHWQVDAENCRIGLFAGDRFIEGELPDPDENQEMKFALRVQFRTDEDSQWVFFVDITLRRGIHGIYAEVGNSAHSHQISPSSFGEYNLGRVISEVEQAIANMTDSLAQKQVLK